MKDLNRNLALEEVTFFLIEKAIKSIKRFTTKSFGEHGIDGTVDQWLVMKKVFDQPGVSQKEVAQLLFKDTASITRILDVLSQRGWIVRTPDSGDRRRFELSLTQEGKEVMEKSMDLVIEIRKQALEGISTEELEMMRSGLEKIANNLAVGKTLFREKK